MAVGGATDKSIHAGLAQSVSHAVKEFAGGAVGGSTSGASIARTLGDIAASAIPIVGEHKALQDLYAGVRSGDVAKVVGGLVGLIPVAGSAATAVARSGKKAATQASAQIAEKGISAATLHLSQKAADSARTAVKAAAASPKLKEQLAKAGEAAYGRTMEILQERLTNMAAEGRLPLVKTRDHATFIDARKAAFAELGIERPDSSWQSLFVEQDGKQQVVGKHQPVPEGQSVDELLSSLGFRFIEPAKTEASSPGPSEYQLMWWKQPDAKSDPVFGVESFSASRGEAQKIFDAYLNQSKSFRARKG